MKRDAQYIRHTNRILILCIIHVQTNFLKLFRLAMYVCVCTLQFLYKSSGFIINYVLFTLNQRIFGEHALESKKKKLFYIILTGNKHFFKKIFCNSQLQPGFIKNTA